MDVLNFIKDNTWLTEWFTGVGALFAAFSAIGAFVKYRGKVNEKKNRKLIRARNMATITRIQLDAIRRSRTSDIDEHKKSIPAALDKLLDEISSVIIIPEYIFCLRKLILNHMFFFGNWSSRWKNDPGSSPDKSDKEWASGVINSMLDGIKDDVTKEIDYENLADEFWTEITTPYFEESNTLSIPLNPTKADYENARRRWINPSQRKNMRIRALVEYKVLAEHSLAFCLRAEFSNSKFNELPRGERVVLFTNIIWSSLLDILQEQIDSLCS